VAALLLLKLYENNRTLTFGLFGVFVAFFALKTVTRNPVWESNEKLFLSDAETSARSAKLQNACGGVLFDKATQEKDAQKQKELCQRALIHLDRAVNIYPNYKDAYVSRGRLQLRVEKTMMQPSLITRWPSNLPRKTRVLKPTSHLRCAMAANIRASRKTTWRRPSPTSPNPGNTTRKMQRRPV
jgi:hypothetical protein